MIRPYMSTVSTGIVLLDPTDTACVPDNGKHDKFRVPEVMALALIATVVFVTVVMRPY